MDFEVKHGEPQKQRSDCIVVTVFEGNAKTKGATGRPVPLLVEFLLRRS